MNKIALVLPLLFIFSCATAERMDKLRVGMTRTEVVEVMKGEPDKYSVTEDKEFMTYHLIDFYYGGGWYLVCLKDGKVSAFGKREDFGAIGSNTNVKIEEPTNK